jgi:hypothetical protein
VPTLFICVWVEKGAFLSIHRTLLARDRSSLTIIHGTFCRATATTAIHNDGQSVLPAMVHAMQFSGAETCRRFEKFRPRSRRFRSIRSSSNHTLAAW